MGVGTAVTGWQRVGPDTEVRNGCVAPLGICGEAETMTREIDVKITLTLDGECCDHGKEEPT